MSNTTKSILIVTTSFSPENAIGSVRLSKLAKYLVRLGYRVTVVSPELDADTRRDTTLECTEFESLRRYRVPQSPWFQRFFARRRKRLLAGGSAATLVSKDASRGVVRRAKSEFFRYAHFLYTVVRNQDWAHQVINRVRSEFRVGEFDIVLSSYPSLGAMWSAKTLRKAGYARQWIADFRDPVNYETNSNPIINRLNTTIQNRILRDADHVVAVSQGVIGKFASRYASKYLTLPNGFDPDDLHLSDGSDVEQRTEKLRLCYTGSLYGGERDITVVFTALRALVDEGVLATKQIEFVYAGKEFGVLRQQAGRAGMESVLLDRGYVNRGEALSIQQEADLAVVATWNTRQDQGILTGKLFECFLMRKPIVGVVNGTLDESEFRSVVEGVGGGFVYESATNTPEVDFQELVGFLRRSVSERLETGAVADRYNDALEDYSYSNVARQLTTLF